MFEKLIELKNQNPNLPVIPMVESDVVMSDDECYWMGSFGESKICKYLLADNRVCIFSPDDIGEIEDVVPCFIGWKEYIEMTDKEAKEYYSNLPWMEAIFTHINLPTAKEE